ncbi:MAG: phosphoribosyltransferase family protein [Limnobacter sp.]|nr:phosphoribosyltransferase family protein [Limnobacter sp.]
MEKLQIDYPEYNALINRLIDRLRDSGFQFDWVIGVSRGGLPVADAISRTLKLPMAVVAASSYQGQSGTNQSELKISASVASVGEVSGRCLLVDDLVDSGKTLEALTAHLKQQLPTIDALHTAVLWVKPISVFQPDFAAEHMESDLWIVQPFERRDWQ